MTTVLIAGSRALPPGIVPRLLVRFLGALPDGSRVLLRRGAVTPPNTFEWNVKQLCDLLGIDVEWCRPQWKVERLTSPEGEVVELTSLGREATLARDLHMVEEADLVLCFYDVDQIGDETSGTAALVEKAMSADKIVYAYALNGNRVERVGEHDPKDQWSRLVPA